MSVVVVDDEGATFDTINMTTTTTTDPSTRRNT
jgi:hypothetical protein